MDEGLRSIALSGVWAVLALLAIVVWRTGRLLQQQAVTRRQLDRVLEHLGLPPESPPSPDARLEPSHTVKALARVAGAEAEAIRAYRQQTGLGLMEAQAVVRALRDAPDRSA